MSESWSSQSGDGLDDIDAWMARRNAQLALRPEANSVARDLWNQTIGSGDDLYAGNPSDLTAIGLAALGGTGAYRTAINDDDQGGRDGTSDPPASAAAAMSASTDSGGSAVSRASNGGYRQGASISVKQSSAPDPWVSDLDVIGRPQAAHADFLDSLNHNPLVRGVAGATGYAIGLPAGALRAGWHALEGVGHGLNFAGGLLCSSEARAKASDDLQAATHDALQYGRTVLANPSRLADDALSGAKAANRSLNPFATPIPDTASGAFGHELGIGANGGEVLTNIVGALAAPEVFGGIRAAQTFAATREANIAEMIGRGLDESTAKYLSKRYEGQGDHAFIQKIQKSFLGF